MEYVKYGHGKWIRKDLDMYNAASAILIIDGIPIYEFGQDDTVYASLDILS